MRSHLSIAAAVDSSLSRLGPVLPRGLAPIDVESLAVTLPLRRHPRADYPVPEIAFEQLSRIEFPEIMTPLVLPVHESKKKMPRELSASAKALLEPAPGPAPWDAPFTRADATKPAKRRRWRKVSFAAIVGAVTAWGICQTPLAEHPRVRPYAEVVNAKTSQGWATARAGVARGVAWASAEARAYME